MQDGKRDGNRFTAVIGSNGTGKSQLLRSIAEHFRAVDDQEKEQGAGGERSLPIPTRLIALSNMVTDVFINVPRNRSRYRYLGLRQASNNTSTGALRDVTNAAVLDCFRAPTAGRSLLPVLAALGGDGFTISLRRPTNRKGFRESDAAVVVASHLEQLESSRDRTHYVSPEALLMELRSFAFEMRDREGSVPYSAVELAPLWNLMARFALEAADVIRLLRRLNLAEIRVQVGFRERLVETDDLSAGQLLLLSTIARIAAYGGPDSLILVDEPEIGLHPNWQALWIPLLRETIPEHYGCHVIVATHSPFIVSDADDVLTPQHDWGGFEEFLEPHEGRSVDNILYRVFGAHIAGNLMVEKDLQTLVDVVTGQLSTTSKEGRVKALSAVARLRAVQGDDTVQLNEVLALASERLR